ncbi:HAMP domain-containing protein [bacterium]|nr:HAMP domain-containing protein [bacterium]
MKTGKGRIQFALFTVAAISLGTSLLSLSFMNRMALKIEQVAYQDAQLSEIGESITLNVLKARREEKNFIIYLDTAYISINKEILLQTEESISRIGELTDRYSSECDTLKEMLGQYRGRLDQLVLNLQENPRTLLNLQRQIIDYEEKLNNMSRNSQSGKEGVSSLSDMSDPLFYASSKLSTEKAKLFTELKTISGNMISISEDITSDSRSRLIEHSREGLSYSVRAQRNTITLLMITALLLIFLIFYLPYRIFLPYRKLKRILKSIARGNVDIDMRETHTEDELGELSRSFENALKDLQRLNKLKTDKIVADKRNLFRITEEVSEAIIILTPDLTISHINDNAKELVGNVADFDTNTLQELPLLWEPLKQIIENIQKRGRTETTIKTTRHTIRGKKAVIIPNINKVGKIDSIIIVIK